MKKEGEGISREDWQEAGVFLSQSEGVWDMTPSDKRRAECRKKERERGVTRITENLSIVPGSLVEELKRRLSAGEDVTIACGRVITMKELLEHSSITVTITEENGKKKVVVTDEGKDNI